MAFRPLTQLTQAVHQIFSSASQCPQYASQSAPYLHAPVI